MALKQRRALISAGLTGILSGIALLLCAWTENAQLGYLAIVICLVGVVAVRRVWRCSRCGCFLGALSHHYCPHCGGRIE